MKAQTSFYCNNKLGIRILFLPFVFIMFLIGIIRLLLASPYQSKAKVICVGNIAVGGVGKTPLVIKIVEHFLNQGLKVGILSRGYKGKLSSKNPLIIDINKHNAEDVGDEAFMMAVKFNGKVPVCICSNRAKSAQLLENDVDILIMDDGLQNYTLKKDKSVVVFDGEFGIGNGFIIPVGFLRETFAFGMKKADVVVVMRKKNQQLENMVKKYKKPLFNAKTFAKPIAKFKGKKVVAFAGIGNPNKFFNSLKSEGVKLEKTFNFPDHYQYKKSDFEDLIQKANGLPIFTTMKDFVKIPAELKKYFNVLDIDLDIKNSEKFFLLLK